MKQLGMIVVVLIVGLVLWQPATSQDNYEERIASLETRVAALEGQAPSTPSVGTETHLITGSVYVDGDQGSVVTGTLEEGRECHGRPGSRYEGLDIGLPITVRDPAGVIIATAVVTSTRDTVIDTANSRGPNGVTCALEFSLGDIPEVAFYTVTIGQYGDVVISREEADFAGWKFHITYDAT